MKPLALITGASSGIGRELAKRFAAGGHDLILTARRAEELNTLATEVSQEHGVTCHVFPHDLSSPASPQQLFDKVTDANLVVDVLVNNAGFGQYGPFLESDPTRLLQMLQVNMLALTHLTRLFLPDMVLRKHGRILNVASTAAFQPGPQMAGYYATKAYVLSLSEALSYELRQSGVTVTCLCPGPTRTEFVANAALEGSKLFHSPGVEVAPVAEAAFWATLRGQRVVVPGFRSRVNAFFGCHLPRWLVLRIVDRIQEQREH